MITSSTERLAPYAVTTTAAQNEHNGDPEISSPGAAPGAANMNPRESIGFGRGRQSLDHSAWYNGALVTFLATGEDTHGQFALLEVVGRRGNVPPPHIHRREDEIFYVLEGEVVFSVSDCTIKGTPGTMIFLPRDVRHSSGAGELHPRALAEPDMNLSASRKRSIPPTWKYYMASPHSSVPPIAG